MKCPHEKSAVKAGKNAGVGIEIERLLLPKAFRAKSASASPPSCSLRICRARSVLDHCPILTKHVACSFTKSIRTNASSASISTLPVKFEVEWVLSEGRIWPVSLIKYGPVRKLLH